MSWEGSEFHPTDGHITDFHEDHQHNQVYILIRLLNGGREEIQWWIQTRNYQDDNGGIQWRVRLRKWSEQGQHVCI